ncbi:hypothetical protein L9F63_000681, partial [Diploptera punctata]
PSEEMEDPASACKNYTSEGNWENPYLDAECIGRSTYDCSSFYSGCPISPLDFISNVY